MPSKTPRQHRAMEAAANGKSTLGIPKSVGKDYVEADAVRMADGGEAGSDSDAADNEADAASEAADNASEAPSPGGPARWGSLSRAPLVRATPAKHQRQRNPSG